MKTLVISDLHLGVNRTGGTTSKSLAELRAYVHGKHRELLGMAVTLNCGRVIVNGDLTDQYSIPLSEAIEVYKAADDFLSENKDKELVWGRGNHDVSKDSSKLGTVDFIGALLEMKYPTRFKLVSKPTLIDDIYVLPHCPNQEIFDLELGRVPDGVKYLALHCCFDNTFAAESNNSLNITRAQAKELVKRMTLVLGHEHQGRTMMNDKVIIIGNQVPSSVSDCLVHGEGQKDGCKYALVIEGDDMELIPTWSFKDEVGGFREVDWRDLANAPDGKLFIRVGGTASASEAPSVIKAISSLRQLSTAVVITNGVKVEGVAGADELAASVEDIRSVDVLQMLIDTLDPDQAACVRKLLADK